MSPVNPATQPGDGARYPIPGRPRAGYNPERDQQSAAPRPGRARPRPPGHHSPAAANTSSVKAISSTEHGAVSAPGAPAAAGVRASLPLFEAIDRLPVAAEHREGYKRDLYEHGNKGLNGTNRCDTRREVILAEAVTAPQVAAGCEPPSGHRSPPNPAPAAPPAEGPAAHGPSQRRGPRRGPASALIVLTAPGRQCWSRHVNSIPANRRLWNQISSAYQHEHDPQIGAAPRLWGMYSIPDAHLHALGDVTGKRVLELGCGAGQWSRALAAEGATVVGLDLSEAQLAAAERAMGAARYPLVQGAAEQLPFAADSFDLVFCDFGGLSWAPPHLAVPQAARVLRRGGRLVFNVASPWFEACYDEAASRVTTTLQQDYFGLSTIAEGDGATSYQLTYGDWVRVLRGAGLIIDDLIEPRPELGTPNGYNETDPADWAHRWPAELLWVSRKP